MSEFKFVCPSCGQKIKTDAAASGREIDCPGCKSKLVIPAPAKEPDETPPATLVKPKTPPPAPGGGKPASPGDSAPKVTAPPGAKPKPESAPKPAPAPQKQPETEEAKAAKPDKEKIVIPAPAEKSEKSPPTASKAGKESASPVQVKIPESKQPASAEAASKAKAEPTAKAATAAKTESPAPKGGVEPEPSSPASSVKKSDSQGQAAEKQRKPETAKETAAPEPEELPGKKRVQIADMTPAVKRQIVRSARRRISDEAHWIPRLTEKGEYAYAAKMVDGKPVSVDITSPEATHFSILGAVLLEFHERNVTRTARGRAEFLDHELLDAIQKVAGDETGKQEAGPGELLEKGKQVPPVSHAQCLEALDLLDKRYAREAERAGGAAAESRQNLRLAELNRRIELKAEVTVEDLCAAITNELAEINNRFEDLERRS